MPQFQTLKEIYDSLPTIQCQGKCQQSCSFIPYSPVEEQAMHEAGLTPPHRLTSLKWGPHTCSALTPKGTCSIYEQRPLICRLFGLTQKLRCPFGCIPSRWLSDPQGYALMQLTMSLTKTGMPVQPLLKQQSASAKDLIL